MIKKVISIIFILLSIFALYRIINQKSIFNENLFLKKGRYHIQDIIALNRKNLYEMADYLINESITGFKDAFPYEVDIQIKPLSEKIGSGYVLWDQKYNDKLRIVFYKKNNVIYIEQLNVWFLAYMLYSDIKPWTFRDYMDDKEVVERLKRNEKKQPKGFSFLTGDNPEIQNEIYEEVRKHNITINEYMAVYNAAMLNYSLYSFFVHKLKVMNLPPNIKVTTDAAAEKSLDIFLKNRALWPLAFQDYHLRKHWLRYELFYYRELFIFLFLIAALIFFFIQFFRKDLKLIIKEELAKNGVTLTKRLVYKIFWQNWKCLFYQARDKDILAKIGMLAKKIAKDIRNKNLMRRAKELWEVFESSDLSQQTKGELLGNYRKAIEKKTSLPNKENAVDVLTNHLFLLSGVKYTEDKEESESHKLSLKKERGISEKEKLCVQINGLINIQQSILDALSAKNLYYLILAIEVLPKIDSFALDKLFKIGVKKLLMNKKFISALQTEDSPIIKECLEIERSINLDIKNRLKEQVVNDKLLAGKKVAIIGGHLAEKKLKEFIEWTYCFNADEVRYISASKHKKVDSIIKSNIDLIIVIRPVDHLVWYKLQSINRCKFIWVSHYSKWLYLNEVNELLN